MSGLEYMRDPPAGEDRWAAESTVTTQKAVGAMVLAVATLVYLLRIYTRVHLTRLALRWDDYLAGAAMASSWAFFGCTMGMIANGGCGRHFWQVTSLEYIELLKWTLPVNVFYMLSADLAKLSLLVLYLNFSPDRTYRIILQTLIAAFVLYAIIYAGVSIFGCQPFHAHWDLEAMSTAKCVDKPMFFLAASIANVVMDVVILLVPLRIVLPLHIARRQKVSLLLLFATGGGVVCIAAYCCHLTIQLFNSSDYTHGLSNELSWMYGELAGCVICASASTTRAFFARYIPRFLGTLGSTLRPSKDDADTTGMELEAERRKKARVELDRHDAIQLESDNDDNSVAPSPGHRVCDDERSLWSRGG
ncbi:hypothetical protein MCOR27_004533 [Pyricularia oryzae]|nr:hypothetical protein MCOR27_004533 [Pyricularia oryzae]KAI6403057.1 hypothetical protein MCOR20_007456 [Pyricularia oryzae]